LMSLIERAKAIQLFVKKSQDIYRDGSYAVQKFRSAQGPVGDVAEGLGLLGKHKLGKNGEVEMWDVECIVVIYQRRILKPLKEVVKEIEKVVGREEGWTDPQ